MRYDWGFQLREGDAFEKAAKMIRIADTADDVRNLMEKFSPINEVRAFAGRLANELGLTLEQGARLEEFYVTNLVMEFATGMAAQPNLLGASFVVQGEKEGAVSVTGAHGEVLAKSGKDKHLMVTDIASLFWDDLADCGRRYAEAKGKDNLEEQFRAFRWASIFAICTIESFINQLAAEYLDACEAASREPDKELSAEMNDQKRVSLDSKLKRWPRVVAGGKLKIEGELWSDKLWGRYCSLTELRDSFIHNKRRAAAVRNIEPRDLFSIHISAGQVIARVGDAVGVKVDWLTRHVDVFKPLGEGKLPTVDSIPQKEP